MGRHFQSCSDSKGKDKDKLQGRNLPAGRSALGQRRCHIPGLIFRKAEESRHSRLPPQTSLGTGELGNVWKRDNSMKSLASLFNSSFDIQEFTYKWLWKLLTVVASGKKNWENLSLSGLFISVFLLVGI